MHKYFYKVDKGKTFFPAQNWSAPKFRVFLGYRTNIHIFELIEIIQTKNLSKISIALVNKLQKKEKNNFMSSY